MNGDWVLRVDGAPAGWALQTLIIDRETGELADLNNVRPIYFDHGQDWLCEDVNPALREALIKLTLSEKSQ